MVEGVGVGRTRREKQEQEALGLTAAVEMHFQCVCGSCMRGSAVQMPSESI